MVRLQFVSVFTWNISQKHGSTEPAKYVFKK